MGRREWGWGSWNIYFILLSSFLSSSSPSYFILIFVCFPFLHSFSPQTCGARSKLKNISFCLYRFIFLSFLFYSIYFPPLSLLRARSLSHSMWSCCFFVLLCYFIYYYFFSFSLPLRCKSSPPLHLPPTPSAPACLRLGLKCGFLSFSIYIHYYCCDCRDDDAAAAAASAAHNFNFVSVSLYLPSVRAYVCVCVCHVFKEKEWCKDDKI